jgi:cation diffusion facilitator family transporter
MVKALTKPSLHAARDKMNAEKHSVAFLSVLAAVGLTGSKALIGLLTGSLGILSEALHSGLDLVAAVMTLIAVRTSARPADADHHFGHGKIENLSALGETALLLITCGWIIYEAFHRLLGATVVVEVNIWSYIVVVGSIIVDYSRSRALSRVARKTRSQALEADALHFSTDIWSSAVVFIGLIGAQLGYLAADAIAALFVAVIVIGVSYRLGRRSIDVLLDKAPEGLADAIRRKSLETPEVLDAHDIRVRSSGTETFVELSLHLDPTLTLEDAHAITHKVAERLRGISEGLNVQIHTESHGHGRD